MTWRDASWTLRGGSVALAIGAVAVLAQPASAQYERKLAGVRLNSTASTVLRAFGNPNEVVIGDVGVRQPPQANNGGQGGFGGGQSGFGGSGSAFSGSGGGFSGPSGMSGGPSAMGGAMGSRGGAASFGGGAASFGGGAASFGSGGDPRFSGGGGGFSGGGGGFSGGGGGFSGGDEGDKGGFGGPSGFGGSGGPGGFGGSGGPSGFGGRGGAGGGVGQFGQTTSTLARQQEVTWIYNRKVNNNLVSYEFLISPNGNVSQIRVSGYSGGNSRTARNIALGSTYKDVVRAYGFPEEHYQVGRILVASYKKKAHVQFQFLNERGTTNTQLMGNKIVAITVAAVE